MNLKREVIKILHLEPDQEGVRIKKAPADQNHYYTVINKNVFFAAMRDLTPSGFKLWCYLSSHSDGYEFGLSKVDVKNKTSMCYKSYYTAKQELQEKGYLIGTELRKGLRGFIFLESGKNL